MFDWSEFRRRFPFGDLSIRQGEYQARVAEAMDSLDSKHQAILLDLLDQQWKTFIGQLETLRDEGLLHDLEGPLDDAYARLQLNSNLRPKPSMRSSLPQISSCRCYKPPFNSIDYDIAELGDDVKGGNVAIETCKHCKTVWLRYLIEEEYRTASGRWWRVTIPADQAGSISKENAKAFIERQPDGYLGGSYFDSTGKKVTSPMRVE